MTDTETKATVPGRRPELEPVSVRSRLLAHLQTWRLYTLFYVGLVGLAGALLADPSGPVWRLALAWLVPTLGWIGGHYGGDYFDRQLDATAKPHRPIPSGRLPASHALAGLVLCAGAGGLLAILLNWRTLLLVAVALAGSIGYSLVFKGRGLSGNLVRGSLTAFALLFGAMATAPYPPARVIPVAAVFLVHDSTSNLVGTLRDLDGDQAAGYRTFPVRHGIQPTLRLILLLAAAWLLLAMVAIPLSQRTGDGDLATCYALLAAAAVLAGAALAVLVRAADPMPPADALRAHALLVVERVVLAGAFVGLAAGPVVTLLVMLPALVITVPLQARLRSRYEFGIPAGGVGRAG